VRRAEIAKALELRRSLRDVLWIDEIEKAFARGSSGMRIGMSSGCCHTADVDAGPRSGVFLCGDLTYHILPPKCWQGTFRDFLPWICRMRSSPRLFGLHLKKRADRARSIS